MPPAPTTPPCVICNGLRWVTVLIDEGSAGIHLKGVPCECVSKPTVEELQKKLRIPMGLRGATIESFKPRPELTDEQMNELAAAVIEAKDFMMGRAENKWLTLAGTKGWGKTHLVFAILNGRIANPEWGPIGRWATGPMLLAELRAGYDSGEYEMSMKSYQETPLLVLDDLGGEYHRSGPGGQSSWADEQLYRVLDHRYVEEMETVITTNVRDDSVIHPRLRDRIMDTGTGLCKVFTLSLPSYRSGWIVTE